KYENPTGLSTIAAGLIPVVGATNAALVQNAFINGFKQDANLAHIGYKVTSGAHTVVVAYNRLNDKRPNNADTNSYGATYTYALSKRNNLNAVLKRINNMGKGYDAPGQAGVIGCG